VAAARSSIPLVALNDSSKPLRSKLLAVPALRQRYLDYVRDIATKWLDWNAVQPMLKSAHDLIAAEVRLDTRKLYETPASRPGSPPPATAEELHRPAPCVPAARNRNDASGSPGGVTAK
jgi:hypothetical protein